PVAIEIGLAAVVFCLFMFASTFLLIRREIGAAKKEALDALRSTMREAIRDVLRDAHPKGYPTGTAEVLPSPVPAPVEVDHPEPAPAATRGALLPSPPSSVAPSNGAVCRRVEAEEDARRARLDAAKDEAGEVAHDARRTVEIPKLPSAQVDEDD